MSIGKEPEQAKVPQVAPAKNGDVLPPELRAQLSRQFDLLNLPPQARNQLTQTVSTVVLQAEKSHSGPLPPAEDFAAYGHTLPSAPERIMVMAEKRIGMGEAQQQHDHKIETWTLISETVYRLVGMTVGGGLVGGMIAGSAYCAYIGAWAAAAALGAGGAVTGVGGIFVRGRDIAGIRGVSTPQPTPAQAIPNAAKGNRAGGKSSGRTKR